MLVVSRKQLIQSEMALAGDVELLYKALGGGWQKSIAGYRGAYRLQHSTDDARRRGWSGYHSTLL